MAFPDTWLQAWLWLEYSAPGVDQPPNTFFTASAFWWRLESGTVPVSAPDISNLINNVAQQLWFACAFTPVQLFNSKVQVYCEHPGGGFAGVVEYGPGVNDWTFYLPSSICVTMRRKTADIFDGPHGRFYLPHVLEGSVKGNFITSGALGNYNLAGEAFSELIFGVTGLWSPILVSYRHDAAYDIGALEAAPRAALIRKRARPRVWKNSQYLAPKPPPP